MSIATGIIKCILGNGSKAVNARNLLNAGKNIALKLKGKSAFEIRKLNGGRFLGQEGRPLFTNLKSGTSISYETVTLADGSVINKSFVRFGKNNKAAKRMGFAGLEKTYDAKTGKQLNSAYFFKDGEIKGKSLYIEADTKIARPILETASKVGKAIPDNVPRGGFIDILHDQSKMTLPARDIEYTDFAKLLGK